MKHFEFVESLADIHKEHGVDFFESSEIVRNNIIEDMEGIPELTYYKENISRYCQKFSGEFSEQNAKRPDFARNLDLPFFGPDVIEKKEARVFFVFEGSLAPQENLSVTVLSCLWLFDQVEKNHRFFPTYWKYPRFRNVWKSIVPNSEITKSAYVVDAIRLPKTPGKMIFESGIAIF